MENILLRIRDNDKVIIIESSHYLKRVQREYCSSKLTHMSLKNNIPLYINLPKKNKFRITYSHPESTKYNLVIVMFLENHNEIKLITTFPESKSKLKED
ncbi:hypothetical protein [Methanobrevibacter filiformis]|nr:hypothetical protein [Methanobrevibacter filiformis]